jgi:hypothetical protein
MYNKVVIDPLFYLRTAGWGDTGFSLSTHLHELEIV